MAPAAAETESPRLTAALAAAAAAAALYFAFVLYSYAALDGYLDHVEPNVAVPAWLWLKGRPLYPAAGGPLDFVTTFGPLVFLANAGVFALLGGSVAASKLAAVAAAGLALVAFLVFLVRRHRGFLAAAGALAFAGFVLLNGPATLWARPDGILLFLAAAALLARTFADDNPRAAALAVGACIGLAVNLKAHGFLYFLPIVADLCLAGRAWRDVARRFAVIVGVSFAVFLAPFALPGVSLPDYLANMVALVRGVGGSAEVFFKVARYALPYLAPAVALLALALFRRRELARGEVMYVAAVTLSLALLLYPASRPGAGSHHLLPLFPVAVDALLRLARVAGGAGRLLRGAVAVYALALVVVTVPAQTRLWRQFQAIAERPVGEEVRQLLRELSGSVEMGYGRSFERYHDTFLRPILVFAGQPFSFEAMTFMELGGLGRTPPAAFRERLRTCATDRWLIPRDEPPFAMRSYHGPVPAFDDAFRDAFLASYRKERSLRYFDVWSCAKKPGG